MKTKYDLTLGKCSVVGVIGSLVDLNYAFTLPIIPDQGTGAIDMLEIRPDKVEVPFTNDKFLRLQRLNRPFIYTPRDVSEGGGRSDWSIKDRRKLYLESLQYAALIDIEASKLNELKEIIAEAKRRGVGVIVSSHDFSGTPTYAQMIALAERCAMFGGDILKFAVNIRDIGDLSELTDAVYAIRQNYPFKVSSMGTEAPFGSYYRMIDAHAGSPLIYGYLVKQTSSGQIKASRIKSLLTELK